MARRLKLRHWVVLALVMAPVLGVSVLWLSVRGIGPGREVLRDAPYPDRAALQHVLTPGVSHMHDAIKRLGEQSSVGYGVIDERGVFQWERDATIGSAVRRTWMSRRIFVRGMGLFGQQRMDYREIEMLFGPPDLTLREIIVRDVSEDWGNRTWNDYVH